MNAKVKAVVKNMGNSLNANGVVNLRLRTSYSELPSAIKSLSMLNQNIDVKAKLPGDKPFRLGWFMLNELKIAGDGEADIRLRSVKDNVEMDMLNALPLAHDENPEFQVMLECDIEEDIETGEEE